MTARLLAGVDVAVDASLATHLDRHGRLPPLRTAGERAGMLDTLDRSGLLGRGGAGFPAGRKMRTVAAGSKRGARPVVLANGCEGEPASRKDTVLLTRAPHLVLDGIQTAAMMVGADEAHLVVQRGSATSTAVRHAVSERARTDAVCVTVHELPHRYVASEESALVQWLNGGEAKPAFTPPRPFERGVAGRPTLVNNVETLAHLALLARHGAEWFRRVGDPDEPGTLLVSVAGPPDVRRVIEVPTGTTVGDLLTRAGCDPTAAQAVLVGGYFGTWLPTGLALHTPLSHRGLRAVGGALGAGIVAALPRSSCGVTETARVAAYLAAESAGQCGPCINGLPAIADALRRLARGPWDERLAPALDRWLAVVNGRGACRHPDGATRFVASALATFSDDVTAHRNGRPCAASGTPGWLPLPSARQAEPGWR
jgi:NADH:ubiquinone oxidoreductase subunit F (NADH-binding)